VQLHFSRLVATDGTIAVGLLTPEDVMVGISQAAYTLLGTATA